MANNYQFFNRVGKLLVTVANVASMTEEDIEYYDGSTYRDIMDSNTAGRAMVGMFFTTDGVQEGVQSEEGPHFSLLGDSTVDETPPIDPIISESDDFNHIPPHPLQKTRSRKVFWSEPAGAGIRLGEAWLDEIGPVTVVNSNQGGIIRI